MSSKAKSEDVKTRTESKTPSQEVKSPGRPRGRPRSPARPTTALEKSPAGRKSPGRPRKSPDRTVESPGRPGRLRSPGRPKKEEAVVKLTPLKKMPSRTSPSRTVPKEVERNPKGRAPVIEVESDSDVEVRMEKPKAAVRGRTRRDGTLEHKDIEEVKDYPETAAYNEASVLSRRSLRLNKEPEKVLHLRNNEVISKKLSEFSDEEEAEKPPKNPVVLATDKPSGFLQKIAYLSLILTTPLFFVGLYVSCNESHCSFNKLPNLQRFKNPKSYFDLLSLLVCFGYALAIALLSAVPFGGRKVHSLLSKQEKFTYVMNGLLSAFLLLFFVVALQIYNVPVATFLRTKYLQLGVASTLLGIALALFLYVRSFFIPVSALNANAVTPNGFYNFWMGREVNPRIMGVLDLKMFLFRYACIGILIFNSVYLYDSLGLKPELVQSGSLNVKALTVEPTLLLATILQIFYILDALIYEHALVSTFEIQYEGLGFMFSTAYTIAPFVYTYVPKYVLDYGVKLPNVQLGAITVLFIIGYILYRGSNSQKNAFRQNPYSPSVSHMESIPTSQGKKLLISGYWSYVRHPNYLGDILIYLSWVPFAMCYPPVLVPYLSILMLLHRTVRDGKRCKDYYGPAWERYCHRVKYVLIPKVY